MPHTSSAWHCTPNLCACAPNTFYLCLRAAHLTSACVPHASRYAASAFSPSSTCKHTARSAATLLALSSPSREGVSADSLSAGGKSTSAHAPRVGARILASAACGGQALPAGGVVQHAMYSRPAWQLAPDVRAFHAPWAADSNNDRVCVYVCVCAGACLCLESLRRVCLDTVCLCLAVYVFRVLIQRRPPHIMQPGTPCATHHAPHVLHIMQPGTPCATRSPTTYLVAPSPTAQHAALAHLYQRPANRCGPSG